MREDKAGVRQAVGPPGAGLEEESPRAPGILWEFAAPLCLDLRTYHMSVCKPRQLTQWCA